MTFKRTIVVFLLAVILFSGCTAKTPTSGPNVSTQATLPTSGSNTSTQATLPTAGSNASTETKAPITSDCDEINIYIENNKFMLAGKQIWLTGMNAPWQNWNDFGGNYDPKYWQQVFSMMKRDGFNSCRIWINCSSECAINIDNSGNITGVSDKHWQDLDSLFSLAAENEIYIMATLMSFDNFKNTYRNYENWRTMIKSAKNIDSFIDNYVIPFCKRYDDNDYVWSIDLINEPDWVFENAECGQIPWQNLGYYFAKASAAIHENTDDMLVTIGFAMIKYNSEKYVDNYGSDKFLQSCYNNENAYIDFWSTHYYDWQATWFNCPFLVSAKDFGVDMSKPCVVGECSHEGINALNNKKAIDECYEWAYKNNWNGVFVWTDRDLYSGEGVSQYKYAQKAGQKMKELIKQ